MVKAKVRVFGHTIVTVSTLLEVEVESKEDLTEEMLYDLAAGEFGGIDSYAGNGGLDKLIGVDGENDTIAADEDVEWDDFDYEYTEGE